MCSVECLGFGVWCRGRDVDGWWKVANLCVKVDNLVVEKLTFAQALQVRLCTNEASMTHMKSPAM